jgi:hypothetical protein
VDIGAAPKRRIEAALVSRDVAGIERVRPMARALPPGMDIA